MLRIRIRKRRKRFTTRSAHHLRSSLWSVCACVFCWFSRRVIFCLSMKFNQFPNAIVAPIVHFMHFSFYWLRPMASLGSWQTHISLHAHHTRWKQNETKRNKRIEWQKVATTHSRQWCRHAIRLHTVENKLSILVFHVVFKRRKKKYNELPSMHQKAKFKEALLNTRRTNERTNERDGQ